MDPSECETLLCELTFATPSASSELLSCHFHPVLKKESKNRMSEVKDKTLKRDDKKKRIANFCLVEFNALIMIFGKT